MGRPITVAAHSGGLNMDNIQYDSLHIPQLGKACVEQINMHVYMCVCVCAQPTDLDKAVAV